MPHKNGRCNRKKRGERTTNYILFMTQTLYSVFSIYHFIKPYNQNQPSSRRDCGVDICFFSAPIFLLLLRI